MFKTGLSEQANFQFHSKIQISEEQRENHMGAKQLHTCKPLEV